jgi:hypothetical protein
VNEDAVRGELTAAATALQSVLPASRRAGDMRYGPLFAALDARPEREPYAAAVELIYEGYLLHYRTSRVLAGRGAAHAAARLLAGDYFYANGLRRLAERGDVAGVDLLSRLMAACSYLRLAGAPFSHDDDLWAFTIAALAAAGARGAPATASAFYAEFDILVRSGRIDDVPRAVRTHAAALPLAGRRPLDILLDRRAPAAAGAVAEV